MKVEAKYRLIPFIVLFCLFLSTCSAHNPFIITNTTQSSPVSQSKYLAHNDRVFITVQSLPSTIDVGKIWYGSSENVYTSMADRARELGANSIIQAKTWHQPSGFSWAAPHGSGQAVRISDIKVLDSLGIKGSCIRLFQVPLATRLALMPTLMPKQSVRDGRRKSAAPLNARHYTARGKLDA